MSVLNEVTFTPPAELFLSIIVWMNVQKLNNSVNEKILQIASLEGYMVVTDGIHCVSSRHAYLILDSST